MPIDGPTNLALTRKTATNCHDVNHDARVFDDKAANEVLAEADSQYRSGYPTLATSSMLARRNRIIQIPEESEQPDMKFFAELVKPLQYRWKFQREKLKTLTPSKHGFHPRSKSPTFHRLIEATEKLQNLAQNETEINEDRFDNRELETQSQAYVEDTSEPTVLRYTRSEPYSTRSSNVTSLPVMAKSKTADDLAPEVKSVQKIKDDETFIEEDEEDESYQTPERTPTPTKPEPRKDQGKSRTVDFKKLESHTELHFFLPQIQDQMSRDGTPDRDIRPNNKVVLPVIKDTVSEIKTFDEDRSRPRKDRHRTDGKRKKKKISRVKSGNKDKEVPDILNDVPTLISMEKEKPNDYHTASMCVFENCKYHMDHKKSTKIRQP